MTLSDRQLLFVVGPPRGGTTLLLRMLDAHPELHGPPEPHLLPPLAHLGFYAGVDKAPYDTIQTRRAAADLVAALPHGEADYLDALRATTRSLYGALLAPTGKRVLVDKTPGNSLVLPFAARLHPDATFVVLTRHPFAVWCSFARSFFDDDWEAAHAHQPLLERYVPAIGAFLRDPPVPRLVHLTYESLVADPEPSLRRICEVAGVDFDPGMVRYGRRSSPTGLGDPVGVDRADAPVTTSVEAWAAEVAGDPVRRSALARMVRHVDDADLAAWGFPREHLWDALDGAAPTGPRRRPLDRHHLERAALVALRRNIHHNPLGRALRRARFALDVLLREV